MTEWQPIETAPRETWVLILSDGGIFEAKLLKGLWESADPRGGGTYFLGYDPTHWMPIPDKPKTESL